MHSVVCSVGRLLPEVYAHRVAVGIDIMFQDIDGFNALEYLGGNFRVLAK